ncbi:MAG: Ldh family oxidoreductase [Betaproteobacteria bacterium]|jgi:LDH2 family malate/lactate/ureidoglycolate dehydrogenase|nr:MAG: Ldh family oxidoreductase [Betaproteobacteria bacterium]
MSSERYSAQALIDFAIALLDNAGMEHDKSATVAEILVEGDLLGHDTHGLQLLPSYLDDIEKDELAINGQPRVIADLPAAVAWDGMRLPGAWLTANAVDLACDRAETHGTCAVTIARSHHIACLAAYLKRATDRGLMTLVTTAAAENHSVAPFGGKAGAITPNPIAAGWPTNGDPVMIDVSMSITTNGMVGRLGEEGGRLPGKWLIDADGNPTDDPAVMKREPPGALLPIGGTEYGHKGYALGLLVEAFSMGLSGHGRADPVEGWTNEVFVQVLNPALFGGRDEFLRQTTWVAEACRTVPPRDGVKRVRLPGESGLRRREKQLREGVELYPSIMSTLAPWANKLGVELPQPLT